MSINVLLYGLSLITVTLAAACIWLFWRNRRLESLLQTRHQFEEMLAQRESLAAERRRRIDSIPLVDEDPAEPQPPAPHQLLLELEPIEGEISSAELADAGLGGVTGNLDSESLNAVNDAGRSNARPVMIGVISHKGGTAKTTTALELARSWAGSRDEAGRAKRILLVDTDPLQGAAQLLGLQAAAGELRASGEAGLFYVAWQPASWPQPAQWPAEFLRGWDLVIVDTPSLQHSLATQMLPLFDALLLTLVLEPACMRVLEQGAILLERRLDPRRQRLLGVLVTRYQPEQALQTSLYSSLQREYVGILLPEVIPEDPSAREALSLAQPAPEGGPMQQAYTALAHRLDEQLLPLIERAGGQTGGQG